MALLSKFRFHPILFSVLFACGILIGVSLGVFLFPTFFVANENQAKPVEISSPTMGIEKHNARVAHLTGDSCLDFYRGSTLLNGDQNHFDRLDALSTDELIEVIHQCAQMELSLHVKEAQELLLGKLSLSHAEVALKEVWLFPPSRRKELFALVLTEWSVFDLTGAISAANDFNEPWRSTLLRTIFDDVNAHSNLDLDKIATEMGLESFLDYERVKTTVSRLLQDPLDAWNVVISDEVLDEEQETLLAQIVGTSIQRGQFEVLDYLVDDVLDVDYQLFDRILAAAVVLNESDAFEYSLNMSLEHQQRIVPRIVKIWSQRDPRAALEATSQVLKSSVRNRAQVQIVQTWAEQNPQKLLDNIQSLPEQLQQNSVLYAIRTLSKISPEKAGIEVLRMRQLLGTVDVSTEYLLVSQWSETDPSKALRWVNKNAELGTEKRSRMMHRILTHYALIDPNEAMTIARSEDPHPFHGMIGLESQVISSLANSGKLDIAMTLLKDVRESALLSSFISVGRNLVKSDRTSQAFELSEQLSDEKQENYFKYITSTWISTNQKDLLENLSKLPTLNIRAAVANEILDQHNFALASLSNDQLEFVRSFLPEARETDSSD